MKKVFTNGCFDILHRGHLEMLKYCRGIGDYVIVGLNSDSSVRRLKGKSRPINCEDDRAFMLLSTKYVDEVVIFEEDTPHSLIKKVQPDIIVKGGDYDVHDVVGRDMCEVRIFGYKNGYSTTKIIESNSNR